MVAMGLSLLTNFFSICINSRTWVYIPGHFLEPPIGFQKPGRYLEAVR
jgi:hypothetical protein